MPFPDIWQTIGTPQVAEITAVISTAVSIVLAQRGQRQQVTGLLPRLQKKWGPFDR